MEYLSKLTTISMLLNIGLLKLMHFNDVHLLFTPYSFTGVQVSQFYRYICLYRYMGRILWDVRTLGSYISKTIYLILLNLV